MNSTENVILSKQPNELPIYVPLSSDKVKGVASFNNVNFTIADGKVYVNTNYIDKIIALQSDKLKLVVSNCENGKILKLMYDGKLLSEIVINLSAKEI